MKTKRSVLSFGAHPDDLEIGCSGTELLLMARGYDVVHCYMTSGEAGSSHISKVKLAKIREKEALDAAKVLGVKKVEFLRYPDGLTEVSRKMKIEVINLIRRVRPEIIFVHASNDTHPDHQILANLILSAAGAAAGPWFQEAKGEPWSPSRIYGYEVWHPLSEFQMAVDISKVIDKKIKSLQCHKSQMTPIRYDDAFKGLAKYRGVMSMVGEYAEVFQVLSTTLD